MVYVLLHMMEEYGHYENVGADRLDVFGQISIGDNSTIGWNAIIMPNVKIGKNCVIGTGAVVTHDIEDNCVVAGVPARVIESTDDYYKKHCIR